MAVPRLCTFSDVHLSTLAPPHVLTSLHPSSSPLHLRLHPHHCPLCIRVPPSRTSMCPPPRMSVCPLLSVSESESESESQSASCPSLSPSLSPSPCSCPRRVHIVLKWWGEGIARCMWEGAGEGTAMDPHAGTGEVRVGMVRVKTWAERAWARA